MPARWGTVAAYAAVAAANQLLWLTYAPITTDAAEHFDVSEGAVGWLSQVFPLLYVLLAIPAGLALDRRFRPALLAGAWLTAVGGAVRLGADTFAAALAGQILIAIAQPLILNAVTKVAADRAAAGALAQGISLGSAGIFAGTALALPLGPALADADSLTALLVVDLVVALAAALWLTAAMRGAAARGSRRARAAPRPAAARRRRAARRRARRRGRLAARSPAPRPRSPAAPSCAPSGPTARSGGSPGVAFLGFGVFVALTTWLQALLEPAGVVGRDRRLAARRDGARRRRRLGRRCPRRWPATARSGRSCASRRSSRRAGCAFLALAPGAAAVAVVPLGDRPARQPAGDPRADRAALRRRAPRPR